MDDYPSGSLDHNIPLLAVSGLAPCPPSASLLADPGLAKHAVLIRSELPPIDSKHARSILSYIQETDASGLPWNTRECPHKYRFKVKAVGREFLLPSRRARLPDGFEPPVPPAALHSPFSPLSPGSSLYPDGLIDTPWLDKHQHFLPSVCLSFYTLTSDPATATLHDNQLKADINAVKNALAQSGYRCRLAVVILSDQSPSSMTRFQDRLDNIRRGTGLDPKASLFVLPTQRSESELESALDSVLSAVFNQAAEYYRDMGRHARKKRSRGITPQPTVPPTSGTSHTLSLQGWNVRYDFKAAVFAEFRQEMDAALRSYEQAYETLMGADVLETIPSWSPRFNDARLLADVVAIRALRCLLWLGHSTAAVRRWQLHRARLADLVDRQARGTGTYGWEAWEARWALVMADLLEKVRFPELDPSSMLLNRLPEKSLSAERLQPWEQIHHTGYWYRTAALHLLDRRKYALLIPEEDRQPPDASPAAHVARRTHTYDSYMCPEPHEEYPISGKGVDHSKMIVDVLHRAKAEFQKRHQLRTAAELALECCKELETTQAWKQVVEMLLPLWRSMTFRSEGWWDVTEALSWTLRKAAAQIGKGDLVVAIDWELLNMNFSKRPDWHYDMTKSLVGVVTDHKPNISISDDDVASFLHTSFVFRHDEGKAGQTVPAQVSITSNAFAQSSPMTFDSVQIAFDGGLRTVCLKNEAVSQPITISKRPHVSMVQLAEAEVSDDESEDDSGSESDDPPNMHLEGRSDLTFAPGQTRVFEMRIPLREAGEARASSVQVSLAPGPFTLKYNIKLRETNSVGFWYSPSSPRRTTRPDPQRVKVLPRPPKMEVRLVQKEDQHLTNEQTALHFSIVNEEDADATTKLDIHVYGEDPPSFKAQIEDGEQRAATTGGQESKLLALPAGSVAKSSSTNAVILLDPVENPNTYEVTVKASYHLVTDPSTPIAQVVTYQLKVVTPFEASYDLLPRLHPDWPSLFDCESIKGAEDMDKPSRPSGLIQKWCLVTHYCSFASEVLSVEDLEVQVLATQGGVQCTTSRSNQLPEGGLEIGFKTIEEGRFDVVAHKQSLDDRAPSTADFALAVHWRRAKLPGSPLNTTILTLPRFYVTAAEPRVLASVAYPASPPGAAATEDVDGGAASPSAQLLFLDITIENPSSHFLTFGLVMEPSDEFAFSGSKTTTVNVLPCARRTVAYRLLPLVRGAWVRPTLVVRDKYFQKVLKIIPTDGMKADKEGVLVWVPPEEEEEEDDDGDEEAG